MTKEPHKKKEEKKMSDRKEQ